MMGRIYIIVEAAFLVLFVTGDRDGCMYINKKKKKKVERCLKLKPLH